MWIAEAAAEPGAAETPDGKGFPWDHEPPHALDATMSKALSMNGRRMIADSCMCDGHQTVAIPQASSSVF